jgi:4-amino-4-deoxy-L-arabinose transferase-like glycosyltransferase
MEAGPVMESEHRAVVGVLLVGGLLLALLTYPVRGQGSPAHQVLANALLLVALAAFGLGSLLLTRPTLPDWAAAAPRRLQAFLGVSAGRLVLAVFAPCFALLAPLAAGEGLLAPHPVIALIAWLAGIGCGLIAFYHPSEEELQWPNWKELALLAGLFAFAFIVRVTALELIPSTLSGDEASAGLVAVQFLDGRANNVFTIGWFSFPSLYFAVESLGILLMGQTIAGLRLMSALAGALTVLAVYALGRTMFGRKTAFLAALLLAASHLHIHFSRIGLNNIWDGFFVTVALAGFWSGWKSGHRFGFLISGLAMGLGLYFYVSIRALPVLLLIWVVAAYWFARPRLKQRLADLAVMTFIAFVVALPLLLFFQQHPDEFNAPLQRVTIFNGWLAQTVAQEGRTALAVIWDQMATTAQGFIIEPLGSWYTPGAPLLLPGAAALFILGVLWALIHLDLAYLLLLLPIILVIVQGGLSVNPPASQRFIIATPMVALIMAAPLAEIGNWLRRSWPRYRALVTAGLLLIVLWIVLTDLRFHFFEAYDEYVLGGANTEVATAVAHDLQAQEKPMDVYFFGLPRMGYYSISTIPYLVPQINGKDIVEPLTGPPEWPLTKSTVFIFLPEREAELGYVQSAYPGGTLRQVRNEDGTLLYKIYEVVVPAPGEGGPEAAG